MSSLNDKLVFCVRFLLLTILFGIALSCSGGDEKDPEPTPKPEEKWDGVYEYEEGTRDPLLQPFSSKSIWNMPIGAKATFIHAYIETPTAGHYCTVDEDLIIMTPEEKLMDVYVNYAEWNPSLDRCLIEGDVLFSAPIPKSFIVSKENWEGSTPNSGISVLMPDGRTIKQSQPFAKCSEEYGTSRYEWPETDLYGDGIYGAHGGSGLSAIGGTLRSHELTPTSGPIKHALKVIIYGKKNLFYNDINYGYRWPANRADGYAKGNYSTERTNKTVQACRMGALLAIPGKITIESLGLETEPARILAQCFQDYGAYIVDDTNWDAWGFATEWGPNGRFLDEFEKNWGFPFCQWREDTPWNRDIIRIFSNLHVVDNNSEATVGGGGKPRVPLVPEITPK